MKSRNSKFGILFTFVCNITILLCFVIGFVIMFKVEPSEKIDKNYFIKYMEQKGCLVNDLQKEKHYFGMVDYLVTDKETCSYLISYATFSDENCTFVNDVKPNF